MVYSLSPSPELLLPIVNMLEYNVKQSLIIVIGQQYILIMCTTENELLNSCEIVKFNDNIVRWRLWLCIAGWCYLLRYDRHLLCLCEISWADAIYLPYMYNVHSSL